MSSDDEDDFGDFADFSAPVPPPAQPEGNAASTPSQDASHPEAVASQSAQEVQEDQKPLSVSLPDLCLSLQEGISATIKDLFNRPEEETHEPSGQSSLTPLDSDPFLLSVSEIESSPSLSLEWDKTKSRSFWMRVLAVDPKTIVSYFCFDKVRDVFNRSKSISDSLRTVYFVLGA